MENQTGIELIAIERQEQITKHGYDADFVNRSPYYYSLGQMAHAAAMLISSQDSEITPEQYPVNWPADDCEKMLSKPYKERLIIAGALLASEYDRLNDAVNITY